MQNKDMMRNLLKDQVFKGSNKGVASCVGQSVGNNPVPEVTEVIKLNPGIVVPVPLKKKCFSQDLIKSLNETHERPVQFSDLNGDYKEGAFLHGSNLVVVDRIDGRWQLTIQGDKPLNVYEIKAARYKFIPDDVYMTLVLPSRTELEKFTSPNRMQLIEIAVTKSEENK